jgi:nesprin-1
MPTGLLKKFPVRLLGTRFKARNCIGDPGTQEPYKDILDLFIQSMNPLMINHCSHLQELITKWDRYVDDHINYEDNYHVFVDWLGAAEEKLDDCAETSGDKEAIEEKKQVVQSLMTEKEHGLMKLNSAIETGEKLYPDTAAAGREQIRQELRTAKEDWDHLLNGLNDASRKFESYLNQLESYSETQDQLVKWINETEEMMVNDTEMKNTLVEKREQLHQRRVRLG